VTTKEIAESIANAGMTEGIIYADSVQLARDYLRLLEAAKGLDLLDRDSFGRLKEVVEEAEKI
jgi:hypothetical protein